MHSTNNVTGCYVYTCMLSMQSANTLSLFTKQSTHAFNLIKANNTFSKAGMLTSVTADTLYKTFSTFAKFHNNLSKTSYKTYFNICA